LRFKLRICRRCGRYTMKDACPECGSPTSVAHPARFSPDDKYAVLKAVMLGKLGEAGSR